MRIVIDWAYLRLYSAIITSTKQDLVKVMFSLIKLITVCPSFEGRFFSTNRYDYLARWLLFERLY